TTTGRVTGLDAYTDFNVLNGTTGSSNLVIATAGGGFWKTVDSGQHWTQLFDAVNNAPTFGGAVAVAPSHPEFVYYCTCEGTLSGVWFYGSGFYLNGTLVTGKGGANPLKGLATTKIIVTPANPLQVWVAATDLATNGSTSGSGVYSYNGVNWTFLS